MAKIEFSALTPLEFLLQVMRDPDSAKAERIQAAKAAPPFLHARLSIQEDIPPAPEIPRPEEIKDQIMRLLANNPDLLKQYGITH